MENYKIYEIEIANQKFVFEIGELAKQSNGSVLGRQGGTAVLAASVMSENELELDFFPLTVNYFEKAYAAGKFPGGYIKREGKPTDREILISRLIDRSIRPLFPDYFNREVQVTTYALSSDQNTQTDILAINSSALSLIISDIPLAKSVGAVRVGYINGNIVINPTINDLLETKLDIVVAGTNDAILMIEGGASEVTEEILLEACKRAHEEIKKIVNFFDKIREEIGREKVAIKEPVVFKEVDKIIKETVKEDLEKALYIYEKQKRSEELKNVTKKYFEYLWKEKLDIIKNNISIDELIDGFDGEREKLIKLKSYFKKYYEKVFDEYTRELMRSNVINKGLRADGRGLDDIRPISIKLGLFDYTHGSALFTRGETQSLAITTLGTVLDQQRVDDIEGEEQKRFMLHYNFPPFSVGEVGRYGSPGRREIGHGHLAERSLEYIIPDFEDFPYTIRVVSEILESNGSSSMASVCGGSLSLFNAGVPIKKHVAGIAMGLITEEGKYAILTDIMGLEDHLGDMDFKVAGTRDGITGFQMDVKIEGISFEIFKEALYKAKEGRLKILETIEKACMDKNSTLSPIAPKIKIIKIDPEKIGLVIGPGGKNIRAITAETNSTINIGEDGTVTISNKDQEKIEKTIEHILALVNDEIEIGNVYIGIVKKILEFGLIVEFAQNKIGLVHISELAPMRVDNINSIYKIGDKIKVRLIKIDPTGKYSLSHKEFFNGKS